MGTTIRKRMTASVIALLTVLNFFIIPVSAAEGDMTWQDIRTAIANATAAEPVTIQLTNDIELANTDANITIEGGKNVTLDLNGYKIDRNGGSARNAGSLITVSGNVEVISRRPYEEKTVYSYFTLTDTSSSGKGALCGNNAGTRTNGGAVNVGAYGVFKMYGGTISGNTASNGGGVEVFSNGVFSMFDGTIDGNYAINLGGGIHINDGGTLNLYGGSITNNIALDNSAWTNERGAGIYFGHTAKFNIGGDEGSMKVINVTGNKDEVKEGQTSTYRDDNLYISQRQNSTHMLYIHDEFVAGSKIGLRVSFANSGDDIQATVGYVSHNGELEPNEIFFLDEADRSLIVENGEIYCYKHTHKLVYEVEGNKLTVTCTGSLKTGKACPQTATLEINTTSGKVNGSAYEATLDKSTLFEGMTGHKVEAANIKYYDQADPSTEIAAPSTKGDYTAKYTVTDADGNDYTISVDFAIANLTVSFDIKGHGKTVDDQEVAYEGTATKPADLSESGWEFGGWFKDEDCTTPFDFDTEKITTDTIIYAKWTECTTHNGNAVYTWTKDDATGEYTGCKGVYTCDACGFTYEEEGTVTSKVSKDPTCTSEGETAYTASFEHTEYFSDQEEKLAIPVDPDAHKYGEWEKYDDKQHKKVCEYDPNHVEYADHDWDDGKVTTPATCETDGVKTYTCKDCGETREETINATGHAWSKVTYTWSEDKSTCTAKRTCANDPKDVEEETVNSVAVTTTPATCEADGLTTFTATFKNPAFEEQTETAPITKLGHDWGDWTELDADQHQRVCKNDPKHTQEEKHSWDAGVETKAPTCTDDGVKTFTCTVCGATRTEAIPANNHNWGKVTYTWSADKSTCTATRKCADDKAVETETVKATFVVTTKATCEKDGLKTFTAKFQNPAFATQTATAPIAKTGHAWGEPTYKWSADNSQVTATRVCKNDKKHVETETVKTTSKVTKAATVDAKGVKTFTSNAFKNPAFKVQTKNVDIPKLKPTATPTSKPTATPTTKPTATPTATPKPTSPADDPSVKLKISSSKISLVCGKTETLKATLVGSNAKITWKSSDPKIASVDSNGKITAKKAGSVMISVTAASKKASCDVQVLFKDVTNSKDFWYTPTYYLTDKEVVKGYDNQTLFKPANICTRAQMVTFIWRMVGQPAPKTTTCKFKDVKKTDYFYNACLWGNEKHIVEGYADGTFGPKINCARRHAVTFLWRLAGKPAPKDAKNKFSDVKKADYFYTATLWASEQKILEGYSDGTFRPNGDCLRRQMVTFLYKYDKFVNGKG